ncbi:GTP 3',8-cyclase MoaA [uncultured Brevundimonas sp.]|uniref:GTP 3',8-cyclase MoaA n=1 Tax=uncultured Brevundimonas sp. TaxID=213418 RepID=UPI00261518D0|nr:GTP 3',8-cyclase MoaA [uncultured Brevundimonas sp.]
MSPDGAERGRAGLTDSFGRRFRYLRLSITEVCNFRCLYCLPDGYARDPEARFLSVAEVRRLVAGFAALGVTKVRLTGGEPSVRPDLPAMIAGAANTPGVSRVAMTTNGWKLTERIGAWRDAGLTHLNVSVDSLDPHAFARLTGHDRLADILSGIDQAIALDAAVKVNAVLMRDTFEAGIGPFAAWLRDRPTTVRFIELMRTLDNVDVFERQHLGGAVVGRWLAERGWTPLPRRPEDGPAVEYAHPDYRGRFGLISPYAAHFCDGCNRLRVTARGRLRLCLFGEGGVDLRDLLGEEVDPGRLEARILEALPTKARGHGLMLAQSGDLRRMADVGG